MLEAAAETVGHQLLGERAREQLRLAQERRARPAHAGERPIRREARPTSTALPDSVRVRQRPIASKFSIDSPAGSIS